MSLRKIVSGIFAALLVLVGGAWLGTRFNFKGFDIPAQSGNDLGTVPPPADLPAPVARFVDVIFGDEIPVVESALVMGTADLTFAGITFPARFKFYYDAGRAYYHYIQLGWYGIPIITVNERYMDGVGMLDIPGSLIENDPNTNASANMGLWAEAIWVPSILFTDPRVRWEAVDDTTAHLIIPDAAPEEVFTVHFDPQTGLISEMRSMRYQNPDSTERTLWINRMLAWRDFDGVMIPNEAKLQWADAAPWATWHVEAVLLNVDVSERMARFGGGDYAGMRK